MLVRPCDTLRPTRPQHDAGMRIDPPPSLAWAMGTMPAATAAALPPLDPPGVRDVSHGLQVGPKAIGSVTGTLPNSGLFVRPSTTNPAARWRATRVVSASDTIPASFSTRFPLVMGRPSMVAAK